MKAKQVLKTLRISRATLSNYVKQGIIEVEKRPNGRYEYIDDSVYDIINGGRRITLIYARVSTPKQKNDLKTQVELLKNYCFSKGYRIDGIYSDVASGISFDKRKDFFELLDMVIDNKVERVVITYKDRMSRVGFGLFKHLFEKYGCSIEVMSEVGDEKLDSKEVFDEIVSLLHCYSMKLYSKRKSQKVKDLLK